MGIDTSRIPVDDAEAVQLASGNEGDAHMVKNLGPDEVLLLGAADADPEDGFPLGVGESWPLELRGARDLLFAVCDSGDQATIAKIVNGA